MLYPYATAPAAVSGLPFGRGVGLGCRVAAFDPLTLSPFLWLKADAGTLQTSGGSAAVADADPVGQWRDQSGNGNHVSQATAGKRPLLKLNVQNGRPVVRFDGVNDFLQMAAITPVAQPVTMFCVFNWASGGSQIVVDGVTAGNRMLIIRNDTTANELDLFVGGLEIATHTGLTAGMKVYTAKFDTSDTTGWLNGVIGAVAAVGVGSTDGLTLGASYLGTAPAAVDVCEVIACAGNKTGSRAAVEAYLNGRWRVF